MYAREATSDDAMAIRRLIDGAMLERPDIDGAIEAGRVLVAHRGGDVVGAILLEPTRTGAEIAAIAVNRRHRSAGVGRLLVSAALTRTATLSAEFDDTVAPFYRSLDFEIAPTETGRYSGELKRGPG